MSIHLNQCPISGPDKFFGCEYCSLEFPLRSDRIQHTATHFESKSCTTCCKLLLCINGDWYELHALPCCDTRNDQQNELREAYDANEMKAEAFDFLSDTKQPFKSEENDYESSDDIDRQNSAFDSISILEPHIEMKPIPQIVESLAKLKTNLTISRTRVKKTPAVKVREIAEVKVQRRMRPPAKKRNRTFNKAAFLDHRPQGPCICDICMKTLGNFSSLRNHILHQHCLSERAERVSCNECGQTFSTPGNLNSHKKIHLKCKAYVCTYCGRGFNQLHNLKEHTNRHTGERPYKCSQCDKSFGRKTNLTAHTRVHTGEKPFKCNIDNCDRAYLFEIDLKRHKYSVHGIFTKKHICQICDKVYPENKLLKKHLESHSTGFT